MVTWVPSEANNSISCLPINRKWNYFSLLSHSNRHRKKTKVVRHVQMVIWGPFRTKLFHLLFAFKQEMELFCPIIPIKWA